MTRPRAIKKQAATSNTRLPQIAKDIKALEKNDIQSAIKKGKLLQEAFETCEHGEYMKWLVSDFGWSHDTSLRYREVYALSQNPQFADFDKWNISISALYLIARCLKDDKDELAHAQANAVIEAVRQGRVSYRMAHNIIEGINESQLPFTATTERKYTKLIKKRELYEGACDLLWPQYFEFRKEHPDDCTPLTSEDLTYASQWTPLASAQVESDPPADDAPASKPERKPKRKWKCACRHRLSSVELTQLASSLC